MMIIEIIAANALWKIQEESFNDAEVKTLLQVFVVVNPLEVVFRLFNFFNLRYIDEQASDTFFNFLKNGLSPTM